MKKGQKRRKTQKLRLVNGWVVEVKRSKQLTEQIRDMARTEAEDELREEMGTWPDVDGLSFMRAQDGYHMGRLQGILRQLIAEARIATTDDTGVAEAPVARASCPCPETTTDPATRAGRPCHDDTDPGARLVALAQYMAQDRRDVLEAMNANRAEADDLREAVERAIETLADANEEAFEARLKARKVLGGALIRAGLRQPAEDDDARD